MKGLKILGRASTETRGTILCDRVVDGQSKKIREVLPNGPLYNAQPTPVFPQTKSLNPL